MDGTGSCEIFLRGHSEWKEKRNGSTKRTGASQRKIAKETWDKVKQVLQKEYFKMNQILMGIQNCSPFVGP
jgi:hypothetical protein